MDDDMDNEEACAAEALVDKRKFLLKEFVETSKVPEEFSDNEREQGMVQ